MMRVVSEASSADVQAVLSDQTVRVLANAAVSERGRVSSRWWASDWSRRRQGSSGQVSGRVRV